MAPGAECDSDKQNVTAPLSMVSAGISFQHNFAAPPLAPVAQLGWLCQHVWRQRELSFVERSARPACQRGWSERQSVTALPQ